MKLRNIIKEQSEQQKFYRDFEADEIFKVLFIVSKKFFKQENLVWKKKNDFLYEADLKPGLPNILKHLFYNEIKIKAISDLNKAIQIDFEFCLNKENYDHYLTICRIWAKKDGSYYLWLSKNNKYYNFK